MESEFPQKKTTIIHNSLEEERIFEAGIELNDHEVFVNYPGYQDYYGSNYGRLIMEKDGDLTLKAQPMSSEGYIVYVLSKKGNDPFPITGQRLVADLFLPDYWPELGRS